MIVLSFVCFCAGAMLAQRFRLWSLFPATATAMILAIGTGFAQAYTAWSLVIVTVAAGTSMQIGYFLGICIHELLPTKSSRRSLHTARKSITSTSAAPP
jgi:hypothetical protein